jgi:uncharacterized protein (TIGR00251 family)
LRQGEILTFKNAETAEAWHLEMSFLRETKDGLILTIRVTPRATRDEIVGTRGDALKIRPNAPPFDGKANDRLIRLLGGCLGVAPSQIRIVRGRAAREKQVLVTGLRAEELRSRLDPAGPF